MDPQHNINLAWWGTPVEPALRGSWIRSPRLRSELKGHPGHMRPCLKRKVIVVIKQNSNFALAQERTRLNHRALDQMRACYQVFLTAQRVTRAAQEQLKQSSLGARKVEGSSQRFLLQPRRRGTALDQGSAQQHLHHMGTCSRCISQASIPKLWNQTVREGPSNVF